MEELHTFGLFVFTDSYLYREHKGQKRTWISIRFPNPKEVMIIGVRWLTNGEMSPEGYCTTQNIKTYLVIENMRNKPFYVTPSSLSAL